MGSDPENSCLLVVVFWEGDPEQRCLRFFVFLVLGRVTLNKVVFVLVLIFVLFGSWGSDPETIFCCFVVLGGVIQFLFFGSCGSDPEKRATV